MGVIENRKPLGPLREPIRLCVVKLFGSLWFSEKEISIEDRTHLTNLQSMFTDPDLIERTQEALICVAYVIQDALPKLEPSNLTVPLRTITKGLPDVVAQLLVYLRPLEINSRLMANAAALSGIDMIDDNRKNKRFVMPPDYDGDPMDYLRNTPLEELFDTPAPFSIPRATYAEHGALFAKSGHGKTQTLRAIIANFMQDPDPSALFILDSLGSLIEGIEDLDVFNTTLNDKLVILDPSRDRYMPSLNFFQLQSDDLCFYLFKAIDQSFTQRQATMIVYLMEYMRHVPNASLI